MQSFPWVAIVILLAAVFVPVVQSGIVSDNDPSTGFRRYREDFNGLPTGSVPTDAWYTVTTSGTGSNFVNADKAWQVQDTASPFTAQIANGGAGVDACLSGQSVSFSGSVPDLASTTTSEYRLTGGAISTAAMPPNSFGIRFTGIVASTVQTVSFVIRGNTGAEVVSETTGTMVADGDFTAVFQQVNCTGTASAQIVVTGISGASTVTLLAAGGVPFVGDFDKLAVANPTGTVGTSVTFDDYDWQGATIPAPTITSIVPNSGPTAGETDVTITGNNFQATPTVTFGGTSATNVVWVDAQHLTATTPAHAAGAVNVVVTNPNAQQATLTNGYTYTIAPAPLITAVSPDNGIKQGGTPVNITGQNFKTGFTVTFDGIPAGNPVFVSSTLVRVESPQHAVGIVDLQFCNADGQCDVATYTYREPTPGEEPPGPVIGDTITVASTATDGGKYSDVDVIPAPTPQDEDFIVVAHSVGAANQLVFSVSVDGGINYVNKIASGVTAVSYNHVEALDDQRFASMHQSGAEVRVTSTLDGGATFTSYTAPLPGGAVGGTTDQPGVFAIDAIPGQSTYVIAYSYGCGSAGNCPGADTQHTFVGVSTDAGLTFSQFEFRAAPECGEAGGGTIEAYRGAAVSMDSPTTWKIATVENPCGAPDAYIVTQETTDGGASYHNLPGQASSIINDPLDPFDIGYGFNIQWAETPGNQFTFTDASGVPYQAQKVESGQYLFTQIGTSSILTASNLRIAGEPRTNGIAYVASDTTTEWFRFAFSPTGATIEVEAPVAGDPTAKPWALPGLKLTCPTYWFSYQDPADGHLKVLKSTRAVECTGAPIQAQTIPVDNLMGFAMSPGGLDTTIITREADGMIRSYDPTAMSMRAEADSRCNDRQDGVSALYPSVAYLFCDADDEFDIDGFRVRNFFLDTDPTICADGCSTSGESPGTISEDNDAFIDTPEGMGQIGWSGVYPYTFTNSFSTFGQRATQIVFTFTIAGTGQFGVYAIQLREDDIDPDGFELEQFAPNGQTITQMCSWRSTTNQLDLIGVVHPTSGLRLYRFGVNFQTNLAIPPGDLNPTITPYLTAPGTSSDANGLSCAGDRVTYVTGNGKMSSFWADGPNKGQLAFPDIVGLKPLNRGVAMDAGSKYIAIADFKSATDETFILIYNASANTTAPLPILEQSIGVVNYYQMALDRPAGYVVIANQFSLVKVDISAVTCKTACTDTNENPIGAFCGTGCGQPPLCSQSPQTPGCLNPDGSLGGPGPAPGSAPGAGVFSDLFGFGRLDPILVMLLGTTLTIIVFVGVAWRVTSGRRGGPQ